MKENLAVIPLKEYRELLEIKEKIASAFEEKETMLRVSQSCFHGYQFRGFYIVNENDVIREMNIELGKLQDEILELKKKYKECLGKLNVFSDKKWYQFIPMKRRD